MITGVRYAELVVEDLDRAIEFYKTCGAFSEVRRSRIEDTPDNRAMLGVDNAAADFVEMRGTLGGLALTQFDTTVSGADPRHVYSAGIRHVCLQTRISDEFYTAMCEAGADSHSAPSGLGTGNSYVYIRDMEGNLLELEGTPWDPQVERPWYAHTAIVTSDIDRLTAFYETLVGVDVKRRGTFGPNDKFDRVSGLKDIKLHGAWLSVGHSDIEFWQYLNPITEGTPVRKANEPGWNCLCFESNDLAADHARLNAAGVDVSEEISERGEQPFFMGHDVDGNLFKVLQSVGAVDHLSVAAAQADDEGSQVLAERTRVHAAMAAAAN